MVRLICYNIEYCEGIVGKWYQYLEFWKTLHAPKQLKLELVMALKRMNPDILALVEVDTGSIRAGLKDEVEFISHELKMNNFIEKIKYPISGWLKLFHYVPILDKQANAVISKYDFSDVKYHVFHEGTKRMVIEVTINCPKPVTLLIAHLALGKSARAAQIKELINIVNGISNPVILMGDFNTFNGEAEIEELLAKTHLNDKISLDLEDVHLTEPAWHPSKRLDYILNSSKIKINKYNVLKFPYSDHLPLMIDFEIK